MTPPPPAALRSLPAPAVPATGVPATGVPATGVPGSGGARSLPGVDAAVFRQALARHPAGVAIVTLRGPAGLAAGDHKLVVGRVEHAMIGSGEPPLLHHQRRFTRPEPGTHDDH